MFESLSATVIIFLFSNDSPWLSDRNQKNLRLENDEDLNDSRIEIDL